MQRIEVITGEQKRRRYTPEEKARFTRCPSAAAYPPDMQQAGNERLSSRDSASQWGPEGTKMTGQDRFILTGF